MTQYEASRGSIIQMLEDVWNMFPDKDLSEVIKLAVGKDILILSDKMLFEQLKFFYLQNM